MPKYRGDKISEDGDFKGNLNTVISIPPPPAPRYTEHFKKDVLKRRAYRASMDMEATKVMVHKGFSKAETLKTSPRVVSAPIKLSGTRVPKRYASESQMELAHPSIDSSLESASSQSKRSFSSTPSRTSLSLAKAMSHISLPIHSKHSHLHKLYMHHSRAHKDAIKPKAEHTQELPALPESAKQASTSVEPKGIPAVQTIPKPAPKYQKPISCSIQPQQQPVSYPIQPQQPAMPRVKIDSPRPIRQTQYYSQPNPLYSSSIDSDTFSATRSVTSSNTSYSSVANPRILYTKRGKGLELMQLKTAASSKLSLGSTASSSGSDTTTSYHTALTQLPTKHPNRSGESLIATLLDLYASDAEQDNESSASNSLFSSKRFSADSTSLEKIAPTISIKKSLESPSIGSSVKAEALASVKAPAKISTPVQIPVSVKVPAPVDVPAPVKATAPVKEPIPMKKAAPTKISSVEKYDKPLPVIPGSNKATSDTSKSSMNERNISGINNTESILSNGESSHSHPHHHHHHHHHHQSRPSKRVVSVREVPPPHDWSPDYSKLPKGFKYVSAPNKYNSYAGIPRHQGNYDRSRRRSSQYLEKAKINPNMLGGYQKC